MVRAVAGYASNAGGGATRKIMKELLDHIPRSIRAYSVDTIGDALYEALTAITKLANAQRELAIRQGKADEAAARLPTVEYLASGEMR